MHHPEYVLENETRTILWDFEKKTQKTDDLISARRSDLMIVNKKKKKREHAEKRTLPSKQPTEKNRKKVNWEMNI